MKKLLLLSVMALGAMAMNAQITKLGEIIGNVYVDKQNTGIGNVPYNIITNDSSKVVIQFYDDNLVEYKSLTLNKESVGNNVDIQQVSKNFFTTDGKICFIYFEYKHVAVPQSITPICIKIIDEDGGNVYTFADTFYYEGSEVYKIGDNYCLFFNSFVAYSYSNGNHTTYIYSIPGNGITTDIDSPTAPIRQSNAQKVIENGQMYIILDGVKYAVTGTEL